MWVCGLSKIEVADRVYEFENFFIGCSHATQIRGNYRIQISIWFLPKCIQKVCSQNWPFEKLSFAFVENQVDNW